MKRSNTSREAAACHEAGHAVVAYALGREFDYVTIMRDDEMGSEGHLRGVIPDSVWDALDEGEFSGDDLKAAEDEITISLAGVIAQSLSGFPVARHHGEEDMRTALTFAEKMCETEAQSRSCIRWLKRRAEIILDNDRYCLCLGNLKQALLEHERVTYQQAVEIFQASLAQYEELTSE